MNKISVLIVDDSALMRNLVSRIVESSSNLRVVGTAMNGQFALDKIPLCEPDIIVLDIEMPVMNGLQFLQERKNRGIDIPVVVLSSMTSEGAVVTMQCLEKGASDFIQKPSGSISLDIQKVATRLNELLISYGSKYAQKKRGFSYDSLLNFQATNNFSNSQDNVEGVTPRSEAEKLIPQSFIKSSSRPVAKKNEAIVPVREPGVVEIVAIGISTGGPNALRDVFSEISPNIKQPIVVVQHMPAGFTAEFAQSLNSICPLEVKEAQDGDLLKPGRILIAPGNHHIIIEKKPLATVVRVTNSEPRNGHRPSADVLFESVAEIYQNRALGIIMTGMGRDGAAQLAEMRKQGARTIGQNEESSIVYGMPKVAFEMGAVQEQVDLSQMAATINRICLG